MEPIYYYKTISDTWHFSTGKSLDAMSGNDYLRRLRRSGDVEKLYLDVPEHFEIIKKRFRTPDYRRGRSWQDEYNEEDLK